MAYGNKKTGSVDQTAERAAQGLPAWEVSEQEKTHAGELIQRIEDRLKAPDYVRHHKDINRNRAYVRGIQHEDNLDDKEGKLVRANLIHPEIESMVSMSYAKDPEISIVPTEAVEEVQYETFKKFGEALGIVLNKQFAPDQANLKAKMKTGVRAALTCALGWIKVYYQKDLEEDPQSNGGRINDTQDDMERLKYLITEVEKDDGSKDHELKQQELQELMASLSQNEEVVRAEGLVIEKVDAKDMVVSGEIHDTDNYHNAEWIAQGIWMTEEKAKARFGFLPQGATKYNLEYKQQESGNNKTNPKTLLIRIWEVWSKMDMRVYTVCAGAKSYIRESYTPKEIGERWYGFFALYFDPTDGEMIPLSRAGQLVELQDEHNTTRTNYAYHRKHSVPMWIGLAGKLAKDDPEKIKNANSMEVVLIEGDEGMPINQYLQHFPAPQIDPNVYTTDHIRQDWEFVTRRGDSSRNMITKTKTAAEANIMQQNLNIGTNEITDTIEDVVQNIAQYSSELVLQEMSVEMVQRIVGSQNFIIEQIWPDLTKDEIFEMVHLEVRAGSTGKPDKALDQKQWLEMLPEFRESLLNIVQLRAEGQDELAEMQVKILKETLRRFDERIDVDAFLPQNDENEDDPEKQEEELQKMQEQQKQREAQDMQMALAMKQMVSDIANKDADTMNKIADAESKEVGQQIDLYMQILQTMTANNQPAQ